MAPARTGLHLEPVPVLLVGPAPEPVRAAEPGEPRGLPLAEAAEEGLERQLQSFEDRLGLMRVHEAAPPVHLGPDRLQRLLLVGEADPYPAAPGADPFFERRVRQVLKAVCFRSSSACWRLSG